MSRRYLITGGCGFVGRHLARRLSEREPDAYIAVVDELTTGRRLGDWPEHLRTNVDEVVYADCVEYFDVGAAAFDVVFHLAAVVEGRLAIEHNPLKVARDLIIDAALFRWAVEAKPSKIVYFSSSACYPIKLQSREHHVALAEELVDFTTGEMDLPDMSYGWAKLTGEFLSHLACEKHDLDVAVYRPFSGYGEDQDFSYPFPSIVARVMANDGEAPIEVWGTGEQSRDFIYIDDCVDAVLDTYESLTGADALNLGTGMRTTFIDLIHATLRVLGREPVEIRSLLDKPEGVFARYCDPGKQRRLGQEHPTTVEAGIERVAHYLAAAGGS